MKKVIRLTESDLVRLVQKVINEQQPQSKGQGLVNFNAGDTGGSNATITYSYRGYSAFTYTGPTGTIAGIIPFAGDTGVVEVGLPTDF